MGVLLAIDPGTRETGWAIFSEAGSLHGDDGATKGEKPDYQVDPIIRTAVRLK